MVQRVRRVRESDSEVTITVTVKARVVEGQVSERHLLEFVKQSVDKYHTLRAGHITLDRGRLGGIKPPTVTDL